MWPLLPKGMPDLNRPSVAALTTLVNQLSVHGPVLVGGDFNVHYPGKLYPRDLFAAAGLVPTYDTLGTSFSTGDHYGATIDYVFNRSAGVLAAGQHFPVELNSDHDAVVADSSWQIDPPITTQVQRSKPTGANPERNLVVNTLVRALNGAAPGSTVEVMTADLRHTRVFRKIKAAAHRGVTVHVVTRSTKLNGREKWIKNNFKGKANHSRSTFTQCRAACLKTWRSEKVAKGVLLVKAPGATAPALRIDVNRNLNDNIVNLSTTVTTYTGPIALANLDRVPGRR